MTDHDVLIELLAIKLYELEGGVRWLTTDPYDRAMYRDLIRSHQTAEGLMTELGETEA